MQLLSKHIYFNVNMKFHRLVGLVLLLFLVSLHQVKTETDERDSYSYEAKMSSAVRIQKNDIQIIQKNGLNLHLYLTLV